MNYLNSCFKIEINVSRVLPSFLSEGEGGGVRDQLVKRFLLFYTLNFVRDP